MGKGMIRRLLAGLQAYGRRRRLVRLRWRRGMVRIEASSKCQLKCPLCLTAQGYHRKHSAVGWGHLKALDFEAFLDKHPQVRHVELSNYGEILLNPQLIDIMRIAHERAVTLSALNGVNLNHAPDAVLEAMVRYGFGKLKVSIDGASPQTYAVYRRGGNFERVMENIRKLNAYKQQYGSKYPKLKWQFIVFGHNEHEIVKARQMAKELGMGFKVKFNYEPSYAPVRNPAKVRQDSGLGVASIDEYEQHYGRLQSPACMQLWVSPQINYDGEVLGCCVNHYASFGNAFKEGLEAILQSERYRYAQKMVLGSAPPRQDVPCTHCRRYERIRSLPLFYKELLAAYSQSHAPGASFF
ncbi:MAG: hypothetical protein KatS3mg033_0806 [Thermonema sp.]|nr:MAG: hypothetical protein KatS3mg033_0806 [Thermonema sp.]